MLASKRRTIFDYVIGGGLSFLVLTTLAMLFYPGGTITIPNSRGYSFLNNYFSDLGRIHAHNGAANPISGGLFKLALLLAGAALMLFFVAFARFFWTNFGQRVVCGSGTVLGVFAGMSFIGVALVPADVNGPMHGQFVQWAFRTFLFAVIFYVVAIVSQHRYPRVGAWIFIAFAFLLAGYIVLITKGPHPNTPSGLFIQVVGQKAIVYSSILSVFLQSLIARNTILQEKSSL